MADSKLKSVLFMCGQNAIRSPMAEMIVKSRFAGQIFVDSAGIRESEPDPFTESILAEQGLSKPNHEPKLVQDMDDTYFDLVIALSPRASEVAQELGETHSMQVEYWPTDDPSGEVGSRELVLDSYRKVFHSLEKRIMQRFGA